MSQQIPVVRQLSWWMVLPQLAAGTACAVVAGMLLWDRLQFFSISLGLAVYLLYSFGSRAILMRHHKRGMRLIQRGDYAGALAAFQRSYDFFTRHPWVDRARAITLMLPSVPSVREMALINMAVCYIYLGDKAQAIAYYERALREFPNSSMAASALQFIMTMEQGAPT